ncbi:MAG: hypothetical protein HC902_12780 [Calothrix sp. SM1_5_4]|nr:hypothetical protein [Calothrix sp. SM1_5_4]
MKLFSWLQDLSPTNSEDNHSESPLSPVLKARLEELEKLKVRDLMIARALVVALDADVQLRRVRRLKTSRAAYFPVYKGDLDHILGWISRQKVLELLQNPNEDVQLADYVRPIGFVDQDASVADLADVFLKSASPFLVVRSSHGSTVGIIFLSNFIELIFGFDLGPGAPPSAEAAIPLLRSYEL